MFEFCLYGLQVNAEFELFEGPVPLTARAPGEHLPLQLRYASEASATNYTHSTRLFESHGRELFLHSDRPVGRSLAGQPWCLEVVDVVRFIWTGGTPVVRYQAQREGTEPLIAFWFIHIFLPLHLTLERAYDFIHSAAVEIEGKPVLFIAPSTGGKSTLGDYFVQQGHSMLSDDKVATFSHEDQFWAVPSHPYHRPFRQFEVLGKRLENYAATANPIHAFYLLEPANPYSATNITEITGFRKFEGLLPHYLFGFKFLQEQRVRWLARLASQSRVFKVQRPWNMERLPDVYQALSSHSRTLGDVI